MQKKHAKNAKFHANSKIHAKFKNVKMQKIQKTAKKTQKWSYGVKGSRQRRLPPACPLRAPLYVIIAKMLKNEQMEKNAKT